MYEHNAKLKVFTVATVKAHRCPVERFSTDNETAAHADELVRAIREAKRKYPDMKIAVEAHVEYGHEICDYDIEFRILAWREKTDAEVEADQRAREREAREHARGRLRTLDAERQRLKRLLGGDDD
jgi:hypothetical protein